MNPTHSNRAPTLPGDTGPLAGLDQWPSVNATWQVCGTSGAPQLQLSFTFHPQRYQGQDGVDNAKADEQIYAQLDAQLSDPKGITFSIETALTEARIAIEGARLTALAAWLSTIQSYLQAVAGGISPTVPANPAPLNFPLTGLTTAQLFKLTCSFVMTRPGGLFEDVLATVLGIDSSTTALSPAGAATVTGLMTFAQSFETALAQKDSMLKVMAGPDRFQGGAACSSTLWALLVGLTPGQPISYAVTDAGAPIVFAPAPISTSLVSRANIPIFAYASGKPINFDVSSYSLDFTDIDLDQWTRQIFAAVDTLLSPEFIAPLAILDEKMGAAALATLQRFKTQLAKMYARQMAPVFDDQSGASNATVKEIFGRRLCEQLGNAWQTQAALQFSADVAATIVEQPAPAAPPNLYGPVVQRDATANPGVAFTGAKLPLATATAALAFLVTTPGGSGDNSSASRITVDLDYTPTSIEHQIGKASGTIGDLASSRLQFVIPLPALGQTGSMAAALGSFEAPLVLRAYPDTPAMVEQTGSQTNPLATDLTEVTQWTYSFTWTLPLHYLQDSIHVLVLFNAAQNQTRAAARLSGTFPWSDTFPWMAEFVTVYPAVEKDLAGTLATITAQTSDQTVLTTAQAAIDAVNAMLEKIVETDTKEVVALPRFAAHRSPQRHRSMTGDSWEFSLREAPSTTAIHGRANVLLMTVTVTSGNVPQVQIASYTMVPYTGNALPPNTYQYYFLDDRQEPLDFGIARRIAGRTVVFPGLQILHLQGALATAHITRNEHLVSDPARKTNPAFVYRTPDAAFADACMPGIVTRQQIDIAMIGSSDNQPVIRSLSAHLTALFQALVVNASTSTMSVKAAVLYQYAINPPAGVASLPVTVPVLMQPPLAVTFSGPAPAKGVSLEKMIAGLADEITRWFAANQPSLANGMLQLSVTIMSGLTTQPMPLLDLANLQLRVQDVQPPLAGATQN